MIVLFHSRPDISKKEEEQIKWNFPYIVLEANMQQIPSVLANITQNLQALNVKSFWTPNIYSTTWL